MLWIISLLVVTFSSHIPHVWHLKEEPNNWAESSVFAYDPRQQFYQTLYFFSSPYQSYENGQPSKFQLLESRHMWRPTSVHLGLPKTAVSNPAFSNVYNPLPLENITLNPKHAKKWGAKENLSQSPFSCTFIQIPTTYDQGELAVSYRWTGWVWEKTGWSSRLQENYRSFSRNL